MEAGELFYKHKPSILSQQGLGGNWVAVEDIAIESFLVKKIKDAYPTHTIISREMSSVVNYDTGLESQMIKNTPEHAWIIHPLDGTANAVFGFPHYGVSVAYLKDGNVMASAGYDIPNRILYFAQRDKGAYMEYKQNSLTEKLNVRTELLDQGLVCTGSPHLRRNFQLNTSILEKVLAAGARIVIIGSAINGTAYVAEGKLSLYFMKGLKPWHIAAGSLLVSEAGGAAVNFNGKLNVLHNDTFVCGNKKIVNEFLKLI